MFGFGDKKSASSPTNDIAATMKMKAAKNNELQLRQKTFDLVLRTKSLGVTTARVVFVIDVSGSMQGLFTNGTVQKTIERLMPVAVRFDDNGSMEVYLFSNNCKEIQPATPTNFFNFIDDFAVNEAEWCGTSYAPVMKKILSRYGIKESSKDPTFVIFVTDGDNDDHSAAQQAITEASKYNIFWKFIGIGRTSFSFLKKLDTMSGRTVDNANFQEMDDIENISDEDLYEKLLEEYDIWQVAAKQKGIL